jgi:prolyl-tRNA synthetase
VIPGTHFDLTETFDLRNAESDDSCPKCAMVLCRWFMASKSDTSSSLAQSTASPWMRSSWMTNEQSHPIIMGCYGIGVTRVVASIVETCHDENGIIWPINVAPYTVQIIPLNVTDAEVMKITNQNLW